MLTVATAVAVLLVVFSSYDVPATVVTLLSTVPSGSPGFTYMATVMLVAAALLTVPMGQVTTPPDSVSPGVLPPGEKRAPAGNVWVATTT